MDPLQLDPQTLTDVVRRALGAPEAEVETWRAEPLPYRVINRVTTGLYRVGGTARAGGQTYPWTLFLKELRHLPPDAGSSFNPSDDPAHWNYWRREALVYQSGLLDTLPPELAAPRCYAVSEPAAETLWLWLEDIAGERASEWPLERYGLAARHLGLFQGAAAPPALPWLSRGWLRAWVPEDPGDTPDLAADPRAWRHPLIAGIAPPDASERVQRLREEREALLQTAERLPQTLCHLDFWPPNLFARRTPDGRDQTVLIDWSQAGPGARGEDPANLVLDSVWMGWVAPEHLAELERLVYAGYLEGLRAAGWDGGAREIRLAFTLTCALRFGLLATAMLRQIHDPAQHELLAQRYRLPFARVAAQRAAAVAYALDLAAEMRALLT